MRIVFLQSSLVQYTVQLANPLSRMNEVFIVILEGAGGISDSDDPDDAAEVLDFVLEPVVNVKLMNARRKRDPRSLLTAYKAARYIQGLQPDLIHIHDATDYRTYFMLSLMLRNVPVVSTIHDATPHQGEEAKQNRSGRRFIRNVLRRRACRVIVHGEYVRQCLLAEGGIPAEKIHVIPIGAYTLYRRWARADIAEEENTILFFGRIWPYKGMDYLIRAEPLITREIPGAKIVIAGQGEDFARYERMMVNRESFMVYNKRIPNEMVAELFQKASVVALPYVEASQSAVVALAFAFGKPVVATSVGGIPEVVQDGETGLIVPPRDAKALADALVHLLRNSELRHRMGRRAYEFGQSALGWQKIAQQTVQVYERAVR